MKYILEWSKKQNACHIDEINRSLERNLNNMIANEDNDYIPLHIGSREECEQVLNSYRRYLIERDDFLNFKP